MGNLNDSNVKALTSHGNFLYNCSKPPFLTSRIVLQHNSRCLDELINEWINIYVILDTCIFIHVLLKQLSEFHLAPGLAMRQGVDIGNLNIYIIKKKHTICPQILV